MNIQSFFGAVEGNLFVYQELWHTIGLTDINILGYFLQTERFTYIHQSLLAERTLSENVH